MSQLPVAVSPARRRNVAPRKRPSTRHGVAIRDAILDASEQLLAEQGLAGVTTNRVAERAGVSIGSLYQYFPNKDAILAEVARRLERRTLSAITHALRERRGDSVREAASAVVDVLLGDALGPLPMRRALRSVVAADWTLKTSSEVDTAVRGMLVAELESRDDVRSGNMPLITFVIAHAIELVVENALLMEPALLGDDAFRDELVTLVVRYLSTAAA